MLSLLVTHGAIPADLLMAKTVIVTLFLVCGTNPNFVNISKKKQ